MSCNDLFLSAPVLWLLVLCSSRQHRDCIAVLEYEPNHVFGAASPNSVSTLPYYFGSDLQTVGPLAKQSIPVRTGRKLQLWSCGDVFASLLFSCEGKWGSFIFSAVEVAGRSNYAKLNSVMYRQKITLALPVHSLESYPKHSARVSRYARIIVFLARFSPPAIAKTFLQHKLQTFISLGSRARVRNVRGTL